MPYKHTQIGYVALISMCLVALMAMAIKAPVLLVFAVIVGVLFSTLTVSVEGERLRFWFGPGFLNKEISLGEIESCQITKFRFGCWGVWGLPRKGWLYGVSGFHTVRLKLRNGEKYWIGTDQPEALEKAIGEATHSSLHRVFKTE